MNNHTNIKDILYKEQKFQKNKNTYKHFTSVLNKNYLPFSKDRINIKHKNKSLISEENGKNNNLNLNLNNIDSEFFPNNNENNNLILKSNSNIMNLNHNIDNIQNDNLSLYFQMNMNMKDNNNNKIEYKNNIYNSTGKQKKKFIRNLSEEQQYKKNNLKLNYQKSSLRKESSYINRILYNKKNNFFQDTLGGIKNNVEYTSNINKRNNFKKILSRSSFNNNNSLYDIEDKKYNYKNSKQNNNENYNNNFGNIESFKYQNSLKLMIPNKEKYKINNSITNENSNIQNDTIKKYISINKIENFLPKKNKINKNNNNLKNENNYLKKIKTNTYAPINNINCVFTNPDEDNKKNHNYLIRDSLNNGNNNSFRLSLNKVNSYKNYNDKSCPKLYLNKNDIPRTNYTNINNINNNNNYIVNVNKYIIVDKKRKIIKKNNDNKNDIKMNNYNSYKIINNQKNIKKINYEKYLKKKINFKNNNYANSPSSFNFKKYKSVNENVYLPSSKDIYNKNFEEDQNIDKNNYRINTISNNSGKNLIEFKKLKTNFKNENIYENKILNSSLKKQRPIRVESELKSSIIDYSNSYNYLFKNNNNSSIIKGINNLNDNIPYNNKYILDKIYDNSFSNSKNLNTSQRKTLKNYSYNINLNNTDKNNYKKGRNEKYNLGTFFNQQNIGLKLNAKMIKINSNRNPNININNRITKTISIFEKEKKNFENKLNIKKDENIDNSLGNNFNLIKLMKTLNEYKNKNNKTRYENYLSINNNINNKKKNNNYKINNDKIDVDDNFVNKRNIKNSYIPPYSEMNLKYFNEFRISQNIKQNTLTMFSIYILSYYFTDFHKIGLSKIVLLNNDKKPIPVVCSNNNCGKDSNKLFSISTNDKKNDYNKPFITEYKQNIYINFYIYNIQSNNVKYIQITNFTDIKNKVSPVGKIEICHSKKILFNGRLNSNKINTIEIPSYNNEEKYNNNINEIQDLNDINEISLIKYNNENNKQYSLSKYKSMEEEDDKPNKKKNFINYGEYDNFYTTRNPLYKGFNIRIKDLNSKDNNFLNENEYENEEDNDNNYTSKIVSNYDNDEDGDGEEDFNININSFKNNDLEIDSLLSKKLSIEFNKTNNNTHNSSVKSIKKVNEQEIFKANNNSIYQISNSNSNKNINKINSTLNEKISNNAFFNLLRKAYNRNELKNYDRIFQPSIYKMKDEYSSSFNLKRNIKSNLNTYIKKNNINNNELNLNSYNNQEESFSKTKLNDDLDSNFFNNNEVVKYIEFNKIRFIISSNYGHHKYVGLTGIEFFNVKGEAINIETALTIGALPKDLKTLYNDEKETRIFENVFNKINNTNDCDNMWVTKFKKNNPFPYIELYFKDKIRLSRIRIYNYNERDKLNIGSKTIELYLDDEYYNTIYLKQGTGETAFDFIKVNNKENIYIKNLESKEMIYNLDDSDIKDNEDFGQDITFPINDINQNDLLLFRNSFYNSLNSNFYDSKNNTLRDKYKNKNKNKIKFASFLFKQCYETPYLPCGYNIKVILLNNYYKGISPNDENDSLKYSDIGFNKIEIYNEEGRDLLNNDNIENHINYKIISNCEINKEKENENDNKIILNGKQNENGNNCIFYIFDKPIKISYIKFYPIEEKNKPILNSAKDIKIFIDCKIIFEGALYLNKPTIILFTSKKNIINNIDENYLTNEINERVCKEEKNDKYYSLMLN